MSFDRKWTNQFEKMEVTESSAPATSGAALTANASQSHIAQRTWEVSNFIQDINSMDELYKFDEAAHRNVLSEKPWEKDPHYFKDVRVSALALLKMVIHARSGGNLEIMGLLIYGLRDVDFIFSYNSLF